jgi:hypothetical protein
MARRRELRQRTQSRLEFTQPLEFEHAMAASRDMPRDVRIDRRGIAQIQ